MMKKDKTLRIALSGVLLLAVVAAGVTMYSSESSLKKQGEEQAKEQTEEQQLAAGTSQSGLSKGQEDAMRSGGSDEPETADASVDDAQAENTQEIAANESTPGADGASSEGGTSAQDGDAVKENTGSATGGAASSESGTGTQAGSQNGTQAEAQTDPSVTPSDAPEGTGEATAQTDAAVVPTLNFTEDSVMLWPVSGEVLIDYSMDATTYFTTLDQYKYNSALILGSSAGEPIQATANGQIVSISENEETGVTLTMDLGNGYQAVYGQLKDLAVAEGQTVESGTILGYVSEPTKYYVKEGANLYFGMTKDGNPVDPMIYIETVTE